MKKAAIIALFLILAGVAWWGWHRPKNPRFANVAEYETDMTEALLRGILQEQDAGRPPVYFVAFGETLAAPGPDFIARFADHEPPVRSLISSTIPANRMIIETSTGRVGLIVQIINLKEFIPGTFDVCVRFSNLPSGRDRFTYRISNIAGEWKIESRKPA
jgi:hypothetical protein